MDNSTGDNFLHAKLTKSFSTSLRGHHEGWCQCQGRFPHQQSLEASHARRAGQWRRSWTWSASPPGPEDTRESLTGNWIELEMEFNWILIFLLTKCKCELHRGKWKLMSTFTWKFRFLASITLFCLGFRLPRTWNFPKSPHKSFGHLWWWR